MFEFFFYILGSIACLIYISDNWQQVKNVFKNVPPGS